eukprot:SAG31_NODE_16586_length_703_cov_1.029801_1_plen_111_part_00
MAHGRDEETTPSPQYERIQQERWHKAKGVGRTLLRGGAADRRGARPLVLTAATGPSSRPKLGGQALADAEPRVTRPSTTAGTIVAPGLEAVISYSERFSNDSGRSTKFSK